MRTSFNHREKMKAVPSRILPKKLAAKLELVVLLLT